MWVMSMVTGQPSPKPTEAQGLSETGLLQALFSGHEDASDCVLFDCISHADGACVDVAPAVAAAAACSALPQAHPAWHVAARAHGFQARAPPRVS